MVASTCVAALLLVPVATSSGGPWSNPVVLLPLLLYPLDQIARAEIIDLPWRRVSWGLWWTPRRTSCTLRSGPTVRLSLVGGRIVTVTVPEPAVAVAVAALREAMRVEQRK